MVTEKAESYILKDHIYLKIIQLYIVRKQSYLFIVIKNKIN